ncbi:hypothetical protein [Chitinophaga sp. LS1]|uniref:hypothetical protein n=1 Tax=Chitinophaga sp. LS1 TaxID=3051176 RepID=UPI002AAB21FC|nr:hypothetical protein [Chitinophaga sp. LS1]WPV68106.1 hypothetical protein QQL36_05140 [Chitinophaga sp. LS1]
MYQAERHELTHFLLFLYGYSERIPNNIDDHGLGGWMHYGTRYVDADGNTTTVEGVDNSLSPEAAEKIIKGVPRVPDVIQEN